MSTQPRHRLTIVEVPQTPARRSSTETSTAVKKLITSRTASANKPVKKRTAAGKNLLSTKAKVKSAVRAGKATAAAQKKSPRRRPEVELTIKPALPIEIDIPFCGAEKVEAQPDLAVEEIPATLELSFAENAAANEEFAVENNAHPEPEFSMSEDTGAELEVVAERPTLATETIAPGETPIQGLLLAEPQSLSRSLAFQWNAFLQVLAKGWSWLQQRLKTQQAKKRLRVCESVSLGEKRFIAVVQVDGEQFLVGGSSSSVSTLAHLEQPREFADVFKRYGQSGMQA